MRARFPSLAARSGSPCIASLAIPTTAPNDEGERIVVTVEDDGPGIPPHALERIFERFYTDRPNQGFGQNSGLGLSISRQIVEAHGGRIWAENRPAPAGAPTPRAGALVEGADAQEARRRSRR